MEFYLSNTTWCAKLPWPLLQSWHLLGCPDAISPVNATVWVLVWWTPETVSRMAFVYDMAANPCQLCPLQHPSFFLFHLSRSKDVPRAFLLLLPNRVVSVVLGTWLSFHSSQHLQLRLLDRSQQRCRKSGMLVSPIWCAAVSDVTSGLACSYLVVWVQFRSWNQLHNV